MMHRCGQPWIPWGGATSATAKPLTESPFMQKPPLLRTAQPGATITALLSHCMPDDCQPGSAESASLSSTAPTMLAPTSEAICFRRCQAVVMQDESSVPQGRWMFQCSVVTDTMPEGVGEGPGV